MAKKKIMLVEDEGVSALHLKSDLLALGYEVPAMVSSGEEAVSKAAELLPDLILMDISLDGPMNGIQAAAAIRQANPIPIVYLTAHADSDTLERAKITEPFGYLPKPCGMETMAAAIEVALFKSEADGQRRQVERALRESEEKYRTVANFTYDWEFWIGSDERILYCSPSCEKVTGYPAAAFEADPALLRRLVLPEDLALFDEHRHGVKLEEPGAEIEFRIARPDGATIWIAHVCQPVYDSQGRFRGSRGSNRDITLRKRAEFERERLLAELQEALAKVKLLSGFIPICAACKKIRDDEGYWQQIEVYIRDHSEAEFSHGICPDCAHQLYPELYPSEE